MLLVALVGAAVLASACEVAVGVDIDVAENGSGTVSVGVSLDRASNEALGDLAGQINLDDLARAGWDVSGPAREADNRVWLRASKPFGTPEQLPTVLAEIAGPGVFSGFELRRRAEFAEQSWEVAGQVDPAAAIPELLDTLAFNEGLAERIRSAVGQAGGDALTDGLTARLSIHLPGELRSGDTDFTWTAVGEDSALASVQVAAKAENTTAKTLRLVGMAAAALFVLAVLLNLLGWWYIRRHRKRSTKALLATAGVEAVPAMARAGASAVFDDARGREGAAEGAAVGEAATVAPGDPSGQYDELRQTPAGGYGESWETPAGAHAEDPVDPAAAAVFAPPDVGANLMGAHAEYDDLADLAGAEYDDLSGLDLTEARTTPGDWTASHEDTLVGAESAQPEPASSPTEPSPEQPEPPTEPAPEQPEPPTEPSPEQPEAPTEPAPEQPEPPTEPSPEQPEPPTEPSPEQPEAPTEPAPPDESAEPTDESPAEPAAESAPAPPERADHRPARSLGLVVIGAWGVLFQPADPVSDLLIPFLRRSGSAATVQEVREAHRLATLGRLSTDELWEACGLAGTPNWSHGPYAGQMAVSTGAADLIRSLMRRDVGVACVTNDVSEWSWRLRQWTGFEAVTPWVISSDIGIRKPDPGVFEMLRRAADVPFAKCLVIDCDIPTLDAARSLGMSTALFGTSPADQVAAESSHPAVGDFTTLLRRN